MTDDAAFVWESIAGAVKGPQRRRVAAPAPAQPPTAQPETKWVTLREAADATGMPASTLRNWARKGRVPSRIEDRVEGPRRMVDLDAVVARAESLGRLDGEPASPGPQAQPLVPASVADRPETPEGTMLVPLDAWEKMLSQLGNLHQAGQQLAEARERAAKAETEAAFLRERVGELRTERDELRHATEPRAARPSTNAPAETRPPTQPTSLWLRVYRQWQRRRAAPRA